MKLEDQKILALTVHRPWSELIARGLKTIETRSWVPPEWMLGRYLAVHASTRWDQEGAEFIGRCHARFLIDPPREPECPAGIIAVVQLVGWVQRTQVNEYSPGTPPKVVAMLPGHAFGGDDWRWFHANEFGWVLRGVKRIAPVAARGQQKLWALPTTAYNSVRQRWGKAA